MKELANIVQSELELRKSLHEGMYSDRRQSVLNENFDSNLFNMTSSRLYEELEQDFYDLAAEIRTKVDKILYAKLAKMIAEAGGDKVTGAVLMDDFEDFDADGVMELERGLETDVVNLLGGYSSQLADLAEHMLTGVSSGIPEEE
jgi:hypothetical protein